MFEEREVVRSVGIEDRVYAGQFALVGDQHLFQATPFVWRTKGKVDLELMLQIPDGIGCDDQPTPVTAIVFLDGEQLQLGLGRYARVEVDASHAARFVTTMTVPEDTAPHSLAVLQIAGDGVYSEAPLGHRAPWFHPFVNQIGFIHW